MARPGPWRDLEPVIPGTQAKAIGRRERATTLGRLRTPAVQRLLRQASRRIGWGVADQGMSSLTNFAVAIYIARTLGAVEFGAFSLAYITYSFSLNASRGLGTDPFLVRFSSVEHSVWRRAVAQCTGTAAVVGLVAGSVVLAAAMILHGATRAAFLALGLTMPGLLLQDSWRFSFFARGRGSQAFLNDTVWAVALFPALIILKATGHAGVFWFVFAWGASACAGAAVGPFQARVMPNLSEAWGWVSRHRDLGPRYLLEGTSNAGSTLLFNSGIALILGLADVGYVRAASTLMGPFMIVFFGMGLVTLPEAARVLRRSPRHLPLFCMVVSGGLALMALAWGIVLLVALPKGLGVLMLRNLWRPAYKLVLPGTLGVIGGCISAGAGTGIHALGIARRSLNAMVISSASVVILGLAGAFVGGAVGTMYGAAIAAWFGAILFWWQLRRAMHESGYTEAGHSLGIRHGVSRRRDEQSSPGRGAAFSQRVHARLALQWRPQRQQRIRLSTPPWPGCPRRVVPSTKQAMAASFL
jgi:O-antigen/teichoic acid export membrane protein